MGRLARGILRKSEKVKERERKDEERRIGGCNAVVEARGLGDLKMDGLRWCVAAVVHKRIQMWLALPYLFSPFFHRFIRTHSMNKPSSW